MTSGGATTKHVDDLIGPELISNSPLHTPGYTWPFVDGPHQWCPGEHKFFGWLAQDANMTASNTPEAFFGSGFGFDEATHVLTIPQVTFTKDTPQFDFMYSDIFITEPINTPVPLEFKHLFSAFYITALNRDEANKVTVKEITITGLKSTKSAAIDFIGVLPEVTYTSADVTGEFKFSFTGEALSATEKSLSDTFLIWPQTTDDFSETKLTIKYDYTSEGQTKPETKSISLSPMTEWTAGVVNSINLVFDLEQITFYIRTLEQWNTEEKDIVVEM